MPDSSDSPNEPTAPALARKFGIVPGCSIGLLDAPAPSAEILRSACPPGVALSTIASEALAAGGESDTPLHDLVFLWVLSTDRLTERLAALQWRIVPDGAIWVMLLKKPVARRRGIVITWEEAQAAALLTDLVDNKIATFSDEEYGTRFVIRRDRRDHYRVPHA